MLQEFLTIVAEAERLTAQLAVRFSHGDPAEDLVRRLGQVLAGVRPAAARIGVPLPDEAARALARLAAGVDAAAKAGDGWMAAAPRPDAEARLLRARLNTAYGLRPRGL